VPTEDADNVPLVALNGSDEKNIQLKKIINKLLFTFCLQVII
jgi:hypothetical protein